MNLYRVTSGSAVSFAKYVLADSMVTVAASVEDFFGSAIECLGPIDFPGTAASPTPITPEETAASITPDALVCFEDGKTFKSLKRHLRTHYGLTPDQYRKKWGLPADYPMVAPAYSATRSRLAKDSGLGRK